MVCIRSGDKLPWKPQSTAQKIAIAGLAGIIAATALYPLEFIRGRLSVQNSYNAKYTGIADGLASSIRHVRSLALGDAWKCKRDMVRC